jgi:hypothetical protein
MNCSRTGLSSSALGRDRLLVGVPRPVLTSTYQYSLLTSTHQYSLLTSTQGADELAVGFTRSVHSRAPARLQFGPGVCEWVLGECLLLGHRRHVPASRAPPHVRPPISLRGSTSALLTDRFGRSLHAQ